MTPISLHLVFNKERHYMGQIDRGLFAIGKGGYAFPIDEGHAMIKHAMEDSRRITDSGHGLAAVVEGLDQRDGIGVIDEIDRGLPRKIWCRNPPISCLCCRIPLEP